MSDKVNKLSLKLMRLHVKLLEAQNEKEARKLLKEIKNLTEKLHNNV